MKRLTRRQAMAALAASGAIASGVALKRPQKNESVTAQKEAPMQMPNPIINVETLPASGPWPTQDPFLFCVHHDDRYPAANGKLGPKASLQGRNLGQDFAGIDGWNMYHGETVPGFPRHPHRGFETVTVVRKGLVDHADSLGAAARYGDGDVQWLTAGNGINHSEMFPLLNKDGRNPIDFFQIWLNLPSQSKRVPAHFSMFWAESLPRLRIEDENGRRIELTVVAGQYQRTSALPPPPNSWASMYESDVAIWTVSIEAGATWHMPPARNDARRSLYAVTPDVIDIAGRPVKGRSHVTLRSDKTVAISAKENWAELLLLQGAPIGEPVARYGPFVMNTRSEIEEAFRDYRRTGFGGWPWESHDPVHGASSARFARYADGRIEKPG